MGESQHSSPSHPFHSFCPHSASFRKISFHSIFHSPSQKAHSFQKNLLNSFPSHFSRKISSNPTHSHFPFQFTIEKITSESLYNIICCVKAENLNYNNFYYRIHCQNYCKQMTLKKEKKKKKLCPYNLDSMIRNRQIYT